MSKHQTRNLLIALLPCLGLTLAQPAFAAETAETAKPAAQATKKPQKTAQKKKVNKANSAAKAEGKTAEAVATPVASAAAAASAMAAIAAPAALAATAVTAPVASPVAAGTSSVPPFVFAPVTIAPSAPAFVANAPTPWSPRPTPSIVQPVTVTMTAPAPAPVAAPVTAASPLQAQPEPAQNASKVFESPMVSSSGKPKNLDAQEPKKSRSLLPTITKVYPTGDRPMIVITFSCPTEVIGIDTPSTKILHGVFDLGFGAINYTNLLPWSLQQVCI